MIESLSDKLRAMGVSLGVKNQPAAVSVNLKPKIESLVMGEICRNEWGEYFKVIRQHSKNAQHGRYPLHAALDMDMLFRWARIHGERDMVPIERMAFVDTETTGLAGGTGTLAFMVGIGFYTNDHFVVEQFFLRKPDEERALLRGVQELMSNYEVVVSYNGRAFDVPLLNSRYVINGMDSPFKDIRQLDLLHLARRLWKNRLASRTLGNIEQQILQFTRSEEEVPGWMAPELYYDYIRNGNAEGVAPVFYHNEIDIVTLGALLMYTGSIISNPLVSEQLPGLDLMAIGKLYAELGELEAAIGIIEKGLSNGIPDAFYVESLLKQAEICKKNGEMERALEYLERAVWQGSVGACEEMAKFFEHQKRDYEKAMYYVNLGLDTITKMPGKSYQKSERGRSFQHRLERLLGKWQKNQVN